jgi:hypothetical protein
MSSFLNFKCLQLIHGLFFFFSPKYCVATLFRSSKHYSLPGTVLLTESNVYQPLAGCRLLNYHQQKMILDDTMCHAPCVHIEWLQRKHLFSLRSSVEWSNTIIRNSFLPLKASSIVTVKEFQRKIKYFVSLNKCSLWMPRNLGQAHLRK